MVSTKESPKIMGLKGIHNPDALQHFAGYTYYPWCSKDGQNEGTIVNHLRTVHYKLGLICDQCFGCPMVMSDALSQHGCHTCTNSGSVIYWSPFPRKALTAIPSNQSHQLMNYFTRMLLITTKVIFLKNKQTNKAISRFNSQQPRIR